MAITKEEFDSIQIGDYVTLGSNADPYHGQTFQVIGFDRAFKEMPRALCKETPGRAWPHMFINSINSCQCQFSPVADIESLFGGEFK